MEGFVYLLCAVTALTCSVLCYRAFGRRGTRLLLWCALFFLSLALENVILFIDLVIVLDRDLFIVRTSIALAGVTLLVVGLI